MPDLLRLGFALLPLSCYLMVLGMLRFRKQPTILSRGFDLLLLGLGCIGLIAIGPIELFFPRAAYAIVGNYVWFILLGLYMLVLVLVAFNTSLGLIAYGLNREGLRSVISEALRKEKVDHSWQDDALLIPDWGVQAVLADAGLGDTASLTAIGKQQDAAHWMRLEQEIAKVAASHPLQNRRNAKQLVLVGLATGSLAIAAFIFQADRLRDSISWLFE